MVLKAALLRTVQIKILSAQTTEWNEKQKSCTDWHQTTKKMKLFFSLNGPLSPSSVPAHEPQKNYSETVLNDHQRQADHPFHERLIISRILVKRTEQTLNLSSGSCINHTEFIETRAEWAKLRELWSKNYMIYDGRGHDDSSVWREYIAFF